MNIRVHIACLISVLVFFRYIPRCGFAVSDCRYIFNFLRNLHTVFHCDCISLYFHQWCMRVLFSLYPCRLLRVPWTARRSNQSILKAISPGCSLEGMMLKLKLQYFGHLMQRVDLLEKTQMLGGIGARGEGDDRG